MNVKMTVAAGAALMCSAGAYADFNINIDLSAKPIKDVRTSTCGPQVGYAGCAMEMSPGKSDTYFFETNGEETARAMKEAGAWFQRMWSANDWFAKRNQKDKDGNPMSNPDAAFKFWKANGFKILFTIEAWNKDAKQQILDFVKYIVDNDYKDCVAGFELGNETYFSPHYPELAPRWTEIVNELVKVWPGIKLGINVGELFELNPDLSQVRSRMLTAGEIKRDTYFSAADFNRYSAQFIIGMSNCIDKITHVIWHAYGAESPYSCSYYGMQRFRNFCVAFPELQGKKFWLSEIRPRSDEDNNCQRIFRETLIMAHYSLMTISQPDVDGFNHHQIWAISGGIYQSDGKAWGDQWRDGGEFYKDFRAPFNKPRYEIGSCGVMYRILAEAIKEHPLLMQHGTSKDVGTEDSFFTSARVTDQAYARRRALKEGKRGRSVPKVDGEVEWVAAATAGKNELCLLMVNTKNDAEKIRLTVAGKQFAAPTYRTLSCPEKFIDCRDVPGEGKPWAQMGWEDTNCGYTTINMASHEGMKPAADSLEIEIGPHTVQTVTVCLRNTPKAK